MGMLTAMTILRQKQEAAKKAAETKPVEEEIPFTDPEEPVEEPVKKPARKNPAPRRRKTTK